ncbi:MAG: biotin-dependent carboxyltransferase family protein [Pseudomonadota bacterium]
MSLRVIKPGLQTTVQGAPRSGWRHMGMPCAGPADGLSLGLANRLVGNPSEAAGLEITYGSFEAVAERDAAIAITGAQADLNIDGVPAAMHETLNLKAGARLVIGPALLGARVYLALAGGVLGKMLMGSPSTYLPAEIGGLDGRALRAGDYIESAREGAFDQILETPHVLRPVFGNSFVLRASEAAETPLLQPASRDALFEESFQVGRQSNRMGLRLEGASLGIVSKGLMKSAPVFPGMIQCPEHGEPIVLLADAQTTGGYPRVASVARADRHLLGQIRPGAQLRLLRRSPDALSRIYQKKIHLLRDWMPDFQLH